MDDNMIRIRGARQHNLKNIDVDIPRDKLVVLTGLSGSGKSSLAFDTIYAEGQRRYVESLSSYARMFLGVMDKPDVDTITGLSPAISIDQKSTSRNPRSTVATVTEVFDYLRLLFARVGVPHCPICHSEVSRRTTEDIVNEVMKLPLGSKLMLLAPIVQQKKGNCEHACVCRLLEYQGVNSDNAGGIRSDLKTIEPNLSDLTVDATQIIKDIKHLTDEAKIWQKTAGVHVAQLKCGDEIIIREDVSRHVAVDKVIGAASRRGFDFAKCYISYSGRMPADMLIKVIRVGVPIIISNAAPASSGIDVARAGNITMVGFVRDNRFTVYTAPERVNLKK